MFRSARRTLPAALSALLIAVPALAADGAVAALSYKLDCLPDAGRAESLADWLRLRLSLRGLQEDQTHPALRLCFRVDAQQRIAPGSNVGIGVGYSRGGWGGNGWGVGGGYRGGPAYDVETVPVASLTAQRPDGSVYWQGNQDAAGRSETAVQDALRRLVERLPLD
ncbi:hypothetical protein OL229_14875 [Neisseriaceae bacterium JH1-16]|nr:hypothetical protein [Neisseriaceae bacterium JH1-16]